MLEINSPMGVVDFTEIRNIKNPENVLKLGTDILNKHGVKWCLSFGSALGFHRDGDFIPEDTDIDVAVFLPYTEELINEFRQYFSLLREVRGDGKLYQMAFIRNNLIFDLCFFYKLGNYYFSKCDGGQWLDHATHFDKPVLKETKYGKLYFPNKIEKYLEVRYGDWQVKQDKKSIKCA